MGKQLEGGPVTIDAIGCKVEIADKIGELIAINRDNKCTVTVT
jgi:hypothetical protein